MLLYFGQTSKLVSSKRIGERERTNKSAFIRPHLTYANDSSYFRTRVKLFNSRLSKFSFRGILRGNIQPFDALRMYETLSVYLNFIINFRRRRCTLVFGMTANHRGNAVFRKRASYRAREVAMKISFQVDQMRERCNDSSPREKRPLTGRAMPGGVFSQVT